MDLRNLKQNHSGLNPYAWSDFTEKSKDQAIQSLAMSGDTRTSHYWCLALPTNKCPNWIARWFLYHKFRHRRSLAKSRDNNASKEEQHNLDASSDILGPIGAMSFTLPLNIGYGQDSLDNGVQSANDLFSTPDISNNLAGS